MRLRRTFLPGPIVVGLLLGNPVVAQSPPLPLCDDGQATSATTLKVLSACKSPSEKAAHLSTHKLMSGGQVVVLVQGLATYRRSNPKPEEAPGQFRLVLNGTQLPSLTPLLPDEKGSHLTFDLGQLLTERALHRDSLEIWRTLLTRGLRDVPMQMSVGFAGQKALPSSLSVELRAFPTPWLILWLLFASSLFVILLVSARRTNILRVPGPEPAAPAGGVAPRKAFSLARTQMAAWFFIVLIAYVLIWLLTGALDSITPTVLGLMGISAATGFVATIVDTNGVPPTTAASTDGFWSDIVREGQEATLPRLQMCVWTVVLILISACPSSTLC
jgi:hypothetical protein